MFSKYREIGISPCVYKDDGKLVLEHTYKHTYTHTSTHTHIHT